MKKGKGKIDMNSELLFESIGYLEDELIERSEESVSPSRKLWIRWSVAAACMALLAGGAAYSGLKVVPFIPKDADELYMQSLSSISDSSGEDDMVILPSGSMDVKQMEADQEMEEASDFQKDGLSNSAPMMSDAELEASSSLFIEAKAEPFVSIEEMTKKTRQKEDVASDKSGTGKEHTEVKQMSRAFIRCTLNLGSDTAYTMLYTLSEINDDLSQDVLKASMGGSLAEYMKIQSSEIAEAPAYEFYRVSGHKELQYVILHDTGNDKYNLLEFDCIQSDNYAYGEILELMYGIYSADDIARIVSRPSEMDNTDAGKAQKQAIGELEITDKEDTLSFYNAFSTMTCYGSNRWDMVLNSRDDTPNATLEGARLERYLTIETKQGNQIDTMRYTALGGMFYESGGIAYSALSEADAEKMAEMLKIK